MSIFSIYFRKIPVFVNNFGLASGLLPVHRTKTLTPSGRRNGSDPQPFSMLGVGSPQRFPIIPGQPHCQVCNGCQPANLGSRVALEQGRRIVLSLLSPGLKQWRVAQQRPFQRPCQTGAAHPQQPRHIPPMAQQPRPTRAHQHVAHALMKLGGPSAQAGISPSASMHPAQRRAATCTGRPLSFS